MGYIVYTRVREVPEKMIKINEVCTLLDLAETEAGKACARQVCFYFDVKTDQAFLKGDKGLKVTRYDADQVLAIKQFKNIK